MKSVCILFGSLCLFVLAGCYESHTLAMAPSPEEVTVRVSCDPAPPVTVSGGDELEAVVCHITPSHEVEYVGTAMHVAAMDGTSFLVRGTAGTRYFTRFREFVRGSDDMLGPFEDSEGVLAGSRATSLIGGRDSIRLRAHETVDLVFAFMIADHEDASDELFSTGVSPTFTATLFDWTGHTHGPNSFRLVEDGLPTRTLRAEEVTGDISGPRTRRFSVTHP